MFKIFGRLAMVVAVLSLLTVADAQKTPKELATIQSHSARLGSHSSVTGAQTAYWAYVHPQYCYIYSSSGTDYLMIITKEGWYFTTSDWQYQNVLEPTCQTGNWVGFYIYDSNGDWNQIWTYQYQ